MISSHNGVYSYTHIRKILTSKTAFCFNLKKIHIMSIRYKRKRNFGIQEQTAGLFELWLNNRVEVQHSLSIFYAKRCANFLWNYISKSVQYWMYLCCNDWLKETFTILIMALQCVLWSPDLPPIQLKKIDKFAEKTNHKGCLLMNYCISISENPVYYTACYHQFPHIIFSWSDVSDESI